MRHKPDLSRLEQKKPLCYDPNRKRFIYFREIISGEEKIIPVDTLSHDQVKELIIERNRAGPDYTITTLNGEKRTRDQVVEEIMEETEFGKSTLKAEKTHLTQLLKQIQDAIDTA